MSEPKSKNISWHESQVSREDRERLFGQRGCVVWVTGLSASGKSTIARALEQRLTAEGRLAFVLDGDNLRHRLNSDLGFSPQDRAENIRRVGEVAALLAEVGAVTITAFISPYRAGREAARKAAGGERFVEVYLDTPLEVCETRDPKGLYRRARAGEIPDFTGVSAPYEPPLDAELVIDTSRHDVGECVERIAGYLYDRFGLAP